LCLGGRHAEATHILAQISGKNLSIDNPAVTLLKKNIDDAIALELADGPWKFIECFKSGPLKVRRRFLLAIGMVIRSFYSLTCLDAKVSSNQASKRCSNLAVSTCWYTMRLIP
jgi:hypothetical protein